jgi:hypothetical protein
MPALELSNGTRLPPVPSETLLRAPRSELKRARCEASARAIVENLRNLAPAAAPPRTQHGKQ